MSFISLTYLKDYRADRVPPPADWKPQHSLAASFIADYVPALIAVSYTHLELFAMGGRYYDLYMRQQGLEENLFLAPGEGDVVDEISE